MVIDFHTHVFPPRLKSNPQDYIDRDPVFASLYASPKAKIATAEDLIASMDREEVRVSVMLNLAWTNQELCVETNDYIMESAARYPRRLVGFGAIPTNSTETALRETERCIRGGLRGIGELRPDRQFIENRDLLKPLVTMLVQYHLPLLIHTSEPVGHLYPGKGNTTPELVYSPITSFPELTLVCAHWGGGLPFYALMPEVKKALGNVFFDSAASPFLYSPQVYSQVAQLVGANKVLFGSDYPLLSPARLMKEVKSSGLSQADQELVLSANARRLLGIEEEI